MAAGVGSGVPPEGDAKGSAVDDGKGIGVAVMSGGGVVEGGGAKTVGVGIDSEVGETTLHAINKQTAEKAKT